MQILFPHPLRNLNCSLAQMQRWIWALGLFLHYRCLWGCMTRVCPSEVPRELFRKSIKWVCSQGSRQITNVWASSCAPWNGHKHWWIYQNFRMVLRDKRRACNFISTHTHKVSFMTEEDFFGTYLREEEKGSAHVHVCAREDCLSMLLWSTTEIRCSTVLYGPTAVLYESATPLNQCKILFLLCLLLLALHHNHLHFPIITVPHSPFVCYTQCLNHALITISSRQGLHWMFVQHSPKQAMGSFSGFLGTSVTPFLIGATLC